MSAGTIHYRPAGMVFGVGDSHARRASVGQFIEPQPSVNTAGHGRDRVLWCRLVQFGEVSRIESKGDVYDEWFTRGSLYPADDMALSLEHLLLGGTRIGHVIRLVNGRVWGDAVAWVDESRAGDAALSSISNDELMLDSVINKITLPVSMGFKPLDGGSVEFPPIGRDGVRGIQRNRVEVFEVAITEAPATKGAGVIARTTLTAVNQLAVSK